jgi:hypothetical protein
MWVSHKQWHRNGAIPSEAGCGTLSRPVPSWDGCGIVECELVFKKWVSEHDWKKMSRDSTTYSAEDLKNNADILRLESAQKHLEYLEEKVAKQKHKVIELKVKLREKKGK